MPHCSTLRAYSLGKRSGFFEIEARPRRTLPSHFSPSGRNFFCQVFLFPGRVPLLYRFRLLTLNLLSSGFLPLAPLVAFFAYFAAISLWNLFDNDRAALRFNLDGGGPLRAEVVVIVCDRTARRVGLRRTVESNRLLGLNDALRGNFNSVVVCFGQRGL